MIQYLLLSRFIFLNYNLEGAEDQVFQGADRQFAHNILCVRSEVLFSQFYFGAALIVELNKVMIDCGFELLNFDYTGAGNKSSRFTIPGRYGKLMSSGPVWIITPDRLCARPRRDARLGRAHSLVLFMMNNFATDIATEKLERAIVQGVSFIPYSTEPLFLALKKKTFLLFKSLLGVPQLNEKDIVSTYAKIFSEEFPLMNNFYESDFLSSI